MIMPEVHTQDIGDTVVRYLSYEGDGPPVILLHATGFFPWLWHPVARELAGSFRLLAPFFCEHRTAEPEEGVSWTLLAHDIYLFCKGLGLRKAFFVGHSMGGTVATLAEALHSPLAEMIILIEPIFLPREVYTMGLTLEQHPLASRAIKRKNHWNDNTELMEYVQSRALFSNWDEEMLELYITYGMVPEKTGGLTLACHPRREAAIFMGSQKYDPWPLLPEISCPVLVVEGERSENRSSIDLKKAASLFPAGKYCMVNGAGHLVPMERPLEVSAIIRDFFLE